MALVGDEEHDERFAVRGEVAATVKAEKLTLKPAEIRLIARAMSWRAPDAKPIIKSAPKKPADPRGGLFEHVVKGRPTVIVYEPDKALSDTEVVPFDEPGGIEAFFDREVLPYAPMLGSTGRRRRSATRFRSRAISTSLRPPSTDWN